MSEDRKQHWTRVYRDRSPTEVSWYQTRPETTLALIDALALPPEAPIIDVGGGASTLVDHLLQQGFQNLTILDIAGDALARARARLGEQAAGIDWVEADVTRFTPARHYRLWHDRAVFHFLTDPDDRRCYRQALELALPPGGELLLAAFSPHGPTQCSGLPIVQYDEPAMSAALGEQFECLGVQEDLHHTPSGKPQHFLYFHYHRRGGA